MRNNVTTPRAIAETRAWVERAVVGLNLCPFAKAPLVRGQVRLVACEASEPQAVLEALGAQMLTLLDTPARQIETTLLICPAAFADFDAFNDFLDLADAALEALGCEGELQIASFHPDYRFVDAPPDAISNATNRAPYPTLQLLREASVERAVAAFPDAATIFEANIRRLEALGADGWALLREQCRRDAASAG